MTNKEFLHGINAYSRPSPDGTGMTVDFERMAVDLTTVAKYTGATRKEFLQALGEVYDNVSVKISIPNRRKN